VRRLVRHFVEQVHEVHVAGQGAAEGRRGGWGQWVWVWVKVWVWGGTRRECG
jgi:hypothetical protein